MNAAARSALVTGSAAGLGAALFARLSAGGWRVTGIDRQPGPQCAIALDLGDRDALDAALPRIIGEGPHDLVILNAGISATGNFEAMARQTLLDVVRVNAEAPMVLASALLAQGGISPGGSLVFVSSLSRFTGYPGAAVYAATKDAIAVYAKSLRARAARDGIRTSVVFPGPLRTDHAERHAPAGADPARRMPADEAARLILGDISAGRGLIVPGNANKLVALAGRLAPAMMTAQMRRLIFERLPKP